MEETMDTIYRGWSNSYRHDCLAHWRVLDVNMTGTPCGKKAVFASEGHFARRRNPRGCQPGRVLATHYGEIVVDRLFSVTVQTTPQSD
jgi:hypothetical protein